MIPLLGSVLKDNQSTAASPSPDASATSKQGELEAQANGYQLVLQREPQNPTALRGLLEIRMQQGNLKGTIEPLEQLAKLNPDLSDYGILLAQVKQQTGDREGAATAYRTILNAKPGDPYALQGLVNLLIGANRPEAAIGLLQDTLKTGTQLNQVQPGSVDITAVQLLLGQVYASAERYTEAIAIYDEGINTNKQDFRPVLAKAIVLQQQGKAAEAKPLFTTAVSLAPAQFKDQIKQLAAETPSTPTPTKSPSVSPLPNDAN